MFESPIGSTSSIEKTLFRVILVSAVALRIIQWIYDRSLWVDEAMLALNIREADFAGLLQPLRLNQAAPILFLWIEKAMTLLFGDRETSLRLFPLICGMATLWVVYRLALELTKDRKIALFTLALIGFSKTFIHYSTETKQYSSDVLVCVCWLYLLVTENEHVVRHRWTWFICTGLLAVVLSNISVILIAATGSYFLIGQWKERRLEFYEWIAIGTIGSAFVAYYFFFIAGHPGAVAMKLFWANHFLPINPFSTESWKWIVQHFVAAYANLAGADQHLPDSIRAVTGTLLLSAGIWGSIVLFRNSPMKFYLLILPVVTHLMISACRLYPFNGRLILYLGPLLLLLSAIGIRDIDHRAGKMTSRPLLAILTVITVIFFTTRSYPIRIEETKEALAFIKAENNSGDPVCIVGAANHAANYYLSVGYAGKIPFNASGQVLLFTESTDETSRLAQQYGKIWVLTSHRESDEKTALKSGGTPIRSFRTTGAAAHLIPAGTAAH